MQTCLVNLIHLDPKSNGGASKIAREVSRVLAGYARSRRLRVVFLVDWRFADKFFDWIGEPGAFVIPGVWLEPASPQLRALQPDIVVSPLFGGVLPPGLELAPFAQHVVFMPDALALDRPDLFLGQELEDRKRIYASLRDATSVVTLSDHARTRLIEHLGLSANKVTSIPLGAEPLTADVETAQTLPDPFVFYPANDWPHKRHDLLFRIMIEIWKRRPELYLVLTGSHQSGLLSQMAGRRGFRLDRVIDLGFVDESQLPTLYRRAEALLFVSEHEGFGMPLIEAMVNSCPVICAPLTSIPEVAGTAALYVDSEDPKAWASAFVEELPPLRCHLIEEGQRQAQNFTWDRMRGAWEAHLLSAGLELSMPDDSALQFDSDLRAIAQKYPSAVERSDWATPNESLKAHGAARRSIAERLKIVLASPSRAATSIASIPGLARRRLLERLARNRDKVRQKINQARTHKLGVLNQHPPQRLILPSPPRRWVKSPPKISVVTPSFNQSDFLERTLLSVVDQEYPNLEYVVQDGGSTDNSLSILARYSDRLHYWESAKDAGQSQAINRGFQHTSGEIMAWINSDDVLLPGALQYVGQFFSSHPRVDAIYGHRVLIDKAGYEIGRWLLPAHRDEALIWMDYIPQESLFWRRRAWDRVGAALDESLQFALDWELLLRFHNSGVRFTRVPRFLAAFRVHSQQKTSARMDDLGAVEIDLLRRRQHGRFVSAEEISRQVTSYLRRHLAYDALYRLGLYCR